MCYHIFKIWPNSVKKKKKEELLQTWNIVVMFAGYLSKMISILNWIGAI